MTSRTPAAPEPVEHWKVDRKIPLAVLFAMLAQFVAAGIYLSRLDSRIEMLERADIRTDALISQRVRLADERYDNLLRDRDRIIRVEEQLKALLELVRRIDTKLERVNP